MIRFKATPDESGLPKSGKAAAKAPAAEKTKAAAKATQEKDLLDLTPDQNDTKD